MFTLKIREFSPSLPAALLVLIYVQNNLHDIDITMKKWLSWCYVHSITLSTTEHKIVTISNQQNMLSVNTYTTDLYPLHSIYTYDKMPRRTTTPKLHYTLYRRISVYNNISTHRHPSTIISEQPTYNIIAHIQKMERKHTKNAFFSLLKTSCEMPNNRRSEEFEYRITQV